MDSTSRQFVLAIAGNALYLAYLLLITICPLVLLSLEPGAGTPPLYAPRPDCGRLWHRGSLCSNVYLMS